MLLDKGAFYNACAACGQARWIEV